MGAVQSRLYFESLSQEDYMTIAIVGDTENGAVLRVGRVLTRGLFFCQVEVEMPMLYTK